MKIDNTRQKGPVQKTTGPSGAGAARKSEKAESGQSASTTKASVSVSGGAGQISESMGAFASQRAEKVASIRAAVENGSYKDDSQATANKIVQNVTDYSLA